MSSSRGDVCATTGCETPATLSCPTCTKLGVTGSESRFCSQDCFKSFWSSHKAVHKRAKEEQSAVGAASHAAVAAVEGAASTAEADEAEEERVYDILIGADGDLSDRFKTVLDKLFSRFDVDGDGILSRDELVAFSTACGSDAFGDEDFSEMQEHFDWQEKESETTDGKGGGLTNKGFHMMYQMQSSARPVDSWNDMKNLGVQDQLQS